MVVRRNVSRRGGNVDLLLIIYRLDFHKTLYPFYTTKNQTIWGKNNLSVYLTITTYVWRTGRITNGTWIGRTTLQDSALSSPTPASIPRREPPREQPGSGLVADAPVSGVSAPACADGVWPPLRPVSVVQKNKPSIMLSSNVQSIGLLLDCKA